MLPGGVSAALRGAGCSPWPTRVWVTGEPEGLRERLLSPGSQGGRSRGPGDRDEEAEGWSLIPQGGISAVQPAVPGTPQTRGSPLPTVHQAWGGCDAACKEPAVSTHGDRRGTHT